MILHGLFLLIALPAECGVLWLHFVSWIHCYDSVFHIQFSNLWLYSAPQVCKIKKRCLHFFLYYIHTYNSHVVTNKYLAFVQFIPKHTFKYTSATVQYAMMIATPEKNKRIHKNMHEPSINIITVVLKAFCLEVWKCKMTLGCGTMMHLNIYYLENDLIWQMHTATQQLCRHSHMKQTIVPS